MKPLLYMWLCFVSGCAGCGLPTSVQQEAATNTVWYGVYGATRPPPQILWRTQKELTCACLGLDHGYLCRGFMALIQTKDGPSDQCVAGLFRRPHWLAEVALPAGYEIHETAFGHELGHAVLWTRCEATNATECNGDPLHEGPFWKPGGELERANRELSVMR